MYQKSVLDNGTRLLTERVPSRLASIGIWVEVGSRDEDDRDNGSAHFAEHMLFKGTARRSAQQIARELDILGGMSNAFTSTEHTCYYATVLDRRLAGAVDLLGDIFFNSLFSQSEIELERQVILQEIAMVEDTPDDRVHELFAALYWQDHPLGNTVLGRPEVVANMDSARLRDYVARHYQPARLVIAGAGNIDHDEFVRLWRPWLENLPSAAAPADGRCLPRQTAAGALAVLHRPLEQEHLVLGCPGLSARADERHELLLLNTILGGNMSSRLFQEVREKRGLAYSIYSYLASHSDTGYAGVYLGVDPEALPEALALVRQELQGLARNPVLPAELSDAVDYLRAGMYLAEENMEARMTRLARNEYSFGRHYTIEEVVADLEKVRPDTIQALGRRLFAEPSQCLAAIGPLSAEELGKEFGHAAS
jgi:predicted Zn-dependent peptidase